MAICLNLTEATEVSAILSGWRVTGTSCSGSVITVGCIFSGLLYVQFALKSPDLFHIPKERLGRFRDLRVQRAGFRVEILYYPDTWNNLP